MFKNFIIRIILVTFFSTSLGPLPDACAQALIDLPAPGVMVTKSDPFGPLQLKGILVNTREPLRFDFLVDKGDSGLQGPALKSNITRLAKYFLTCLTVPDSDLWVNLSPYERERIVPDNFGITIMGKDLLEQDYLLKQIMASLSYPENELGKRFWQKVYRRSYELYGNTNIPINTFNKVWIIPKSAQVYVQGNTAFVVKGDLDVMLEADYKAYVNRTGQKGVLAHDPGLSQNAGAYSQVMRDVILPELRDEVNEGKNFAVVRQVYNAMILATWYKRHLKDSLLGRMYVGRNQVRGVDVADKLAKERIYQQYLMAYKKCVYNYIKEDYDPLTQQTVTRKYASGGMYFAGFGRPDSLTYVEVPTTQGMKISNDLAMATIDVTAVNDHGKIISFPDPRAVITDTHPFHVIRRLLPSMVPGSKIRGFLNKFTLGVMLAVTLGSVPAAAESVYTFTSGVNGVPILHILAGNQPGFALEKIRSVYKGLNPEEYKRSPWSGPLYPALNRVTRSQDFKGNFLPGQVLKFTKPVPQNVLEAITRSVAESTGRGAAEVNVQPPPEAPESLTYFLDPDGNLLLKWNKTKGAEAYLVAERNAGSGIFQLLTPKTGTGETSITIQNPLKGVAIDLEVQAVNQVGSSPFVTVNLTIPASAIAQAKPAFAQAAAASSPPPQLDPTWIWAWLGMAIGGIVFRTKMLINSKEGKYKESKNRIQLNSKRVSSNSVQLSGESLTADDRSSIDVALPPPAASPSEAGILAQDLANMQRIANGQEQAASLPPVQEEVQSPAYLGAPGMFSGWKDLWWMDAGAILGGMALSFLDGGISLSLVAFPVLTRGLYLAQKWAHELFHLGAAGVLYPSHFSETFSPGNIKGNSNISQWLGQIVPFTTARRSYVYLPYAHARGGRWDQFRNQIVGKAGLTGSTAMALSAGYFLGLSPLLAPVILGYLAVLKGSVQSGDLLGSADTCNGTFGCGIIGYVKRVPSRGVKKSALRSELTWFFESMDSLTVRGGQQAGVEINILDLWSNFWKVIMKITKQKRNWFFWQTWDHGPVFYRNMIDDLFNNFYNALPNKLVPIYNYARYGVLKVLGHVRFATNGNLVQNAAHPHSSPQEKREQWVYDNVKKTFRKVYRVFQVTSAFNGDHDASKVGIPERIHLFGSTLEFSQMRSFFPAVVHKYYSAKVNITYLKRTVSDGKEYKQKVQTNYSALLKALLKKGYVDQWGFVNRRFIMLDDEFKSWFPDYKVQVINEIESALFGIPPGDAPIIPLEQHMNTTQGNWLASVRYAHVMVNHQTLEEARNDILFEEEENAVGLVFSEVFDQVSSDLLRRGFVPRDPETSRSLSDLYVKDLQTAKSLGLEDQYRMIELFKGMLFKRMQQEVSKNSLAGEVFRQWEKKWKFQGLNADLMRRVIINEAVRKFFTADNLAATKEFAERADGSHGLYMSNTLEDNITLYQDNQDVVVGFNEENGYYAFASDPRVLKTVGPKGEKVNKVLYLKDGEVVNIGFAPSGKLVLRSWMKVGGQWTETQKADLEDRYYPNEEFIDGKRNRYYAGPPVVYDNPRRMVQEDFKNISKVLEDARMKLEDPGSFNHQSTEYLAKRISEMIRKHGKARLRFIGYDNSFSLSEQFKKIMQDLVNSNILEIDVIDPNDFNESPSKFDIKPDDIIMFISKSGATFSTKLSLRLIQKLVYEENIFCMTARIDSVLNIMMGQGLRSEDPFIRRIFITGDFYPAETPVVSDILLEFQLQQLAVNLTRALGRDNDVQNTMGLLISSDRLDLIAPELAGQSVIKSQELTGISIDGRAYANVDREKKAIGTYLGKAARETWVVNRFMDLLVAGILSPNIFLFGYFGLLTQNIGGLLYSGAGLLVNVLMINYVYRFWATEIYRKIIGRPANGRIAPFDLFIAAPPGIFDTQRNFFSRVLTNRLKSIGPAAIYGGDPKKNFVADSASDQKRGDINLRFALKHRANEGKMGVGQATYPQTAVFGTGFVKGRPEKIDVVVEISHRADASEKEISLYDNTVGFLSLMIAAKTIGVEMARVESFEGRLFDLAFTFSKAGVHTTQINPITEEARAILNSKGVRSKDQLSFSFGHQSVFLFDRAMRSSDKPAQEHKYDRPGGIDMNSRLMELKISGDHDRRFDLGDREDMSGNMINAVVPQVSQIVTVTPGMLKDMLGPGYLN